MKTTLLATALAALALGACGHKKSIERKQYDELTASIHPGDDWATAAASVEKLFGPAKVKKETAWTWAYDDGNQCWDTTFWKDGDKVKGWGGGGSVNKIAEGLYKKCQDLANGTAK